jgi:hypothetical protein
VREYRKLRSDAYYFNWGLKIDHEFQRPFAPTHENMRKLSLHKHQPVHLLAANLRRAFSGVVAGNVKEEAYAPSRSTACSKSTATRRSWSLWMRCWLPSWCSTA